MTQVSDTYGADFASEVHGPMAPQTLNSREQRTFLLLLLLLLLLYECATSAAMWFLTTSTLFWDTDYMFFICSIYAQHCLNPCIQVTR